jgi:substrate import-associated zinc metallohydrolase lipoprotein
MSAVSCEEEQLNPESVITVSQTEMNDFDKWLEVNYMQPYNIDFKYRYEMNESDMNYYTVPSRLEDAVKIAHLVKYLCLEAYDETGGITFTRNYFPKLIFTIGEWEYENNGTYILGTAEGGKKILLSGANYIDQYVKDADELNRYYLKTIHHEFTHIMNQTVNYSADFQLITGSGYVADKWSEPPYNTDFLTRGFITAYAQHSPDEDFAEMLSTFVCNSPERWAYWMGLAGTEGERLIMTKFDLVNRYMNDSFGIDLVQLRNVVQRRQLDITMGRIDLESLE